MISIIYIAVIIAFIASFKKIVSLVFFVISYAISMIGSLVIIFFRSVFRLFRRGTSK